MDEIVIEVWGDFACFSQPAAKVERLTYPFPTPSAARGILSAIYSKPVEFYWQVNRIEVLNPIQYISFKRDELKVTATGKKIIFLDETHIKVDKNKKEKIEYIVHTQRQTVALKDVRYRIAASIVPRPGFRQSEPQFYDQALRRIRSGKCFMQPSFGLREFTAYFKEYQPSPEEEKPIAETLDAGLMVYDVFDFIHDIKVQKKTTPALSLFHGVMEQGVIQVPPYESPEVLKGGRLC